jgi:hypothetical protein
MIALAKPAAARRLPLRLFPVFLGYRYSSRVSHTWHLPEQHQSSQHVARVDNPWAIIQSVFLVDPASRPFRSARTWGQFVTRKFQDAIFTALSRHFEPITNDRNV